ncbi:MAG: 8-oxo-dGTP diphosphatase [Candidatus Taylorbacteria bacterium]|nr:8-oxo-dGTP diphosphatase [Candidatus Taylorbacteria bacterium]
MKISTLCFCVKGNQVLLAMKKRGFGVGKWNGFGGKVRDDETPKVAIVREVKEESGLVVDEKDLQQVAVVNFCFDGVLVFKCHVFMACLWDGVPVETEEMRPKWYSIDSLPFGEMWAVDIRWIPIVLAGEKIGVDVNYNMDGSVVKDFNYRSAEFG